MTVATDRPHIETDNEKYGSGFLDEASPGVWMVLHRDHPMHLFTNRQAAEDYIYGYVESEAANRDGRTLDDFTMQVWAVSDRWPDDEED